jgi:hypothetical protein
LRAEAQDRDLTNVGARAEGREPPAAMRQFQVAGQHHDEAVTDRVLANHHLAGLDTDLVTPVRDRSDLRPRARPEEGLSGQSPVSFGPAKRVQPPSHFISPRWPRRLKRRVVIEPGVQHCTGGRGFLG